MEYKTQLFLFSITSKKNLPVVPSPLRNNLLQFDSPVSPLPFHLHAILVSCEANDLKVAGCSGVDLSGSTSGSECWLNAYNANLKCSNRRRGHLWDTSWPSSNVGFHF